MTGVREEEAIRTVTERLKHVYSATRAPEDVETAVAQATAAFGDRPVRDFVPVLVERRARALLDEAEPGRRGEA
ncbi:three-helix bundle dimerization domain-containing protein [Streptomyces lydicus]|uniref:three-helix bundle dimerization domain-containing protein n=1 Tax=Streptomyces lydicus TaxID=47763 RepID=UPI0036FFAFBE